MANLKAEFLVACSFDDDGGVRLMINLSIILHVIVIVSAHLHYVVPFMNLWSSDELAKRAPNMNVECDSKYFRMCYNLNELIWIIRFTKIYINYRTQTQPSIN